MSDLDELLSHTHQGVAGTLYVDDEDLEAVAWARRANGSRPIECEGCDAEYIAGKGWKH